MSTHKCQPDGITYRCVAAADRPTPDMVTVVDQDVPALLKRHERTQLVKTAAVAVLFACFVIPVVLADALGAVVFLCGCTATLGAVTLMMHSTRPHDCTTSVRHRFLQRMVTEGMAVQLSRQAVVDQVLICAAEIRSDFWPAVAARGQADRLRAQVAALRADLARLVELAELEQVDVTAERIEAARRISDLNEVIGTHDRIVRGYLHAVEGDLSRDLQQRQLDREALDAGSRADGWTRSASGSSGRSDPVHQRPRDITCRGAAARLEPNAVSLALTRIVLYS